MKTPIHLYSLSTCPVCRATKKLLKRCGATYDYTDVDLLEVEARKTAIQEIKRVNPALSFPTLVFEGNVIVGYREKEILAALGLTEVPKTNIFKTVLLKIKGRRQHHSGNRHR